MRIFKFILVAALCAGLTACQTTSKLPSDAPKAVKIGKPYSIAGETYYPQYDPHYSEEGIASWYGPGFHGKKTANGETYDQYAMTAAHKTLPMPSLVKVTNLQNGKTVTVRITDRGPFKAGRIIDLSKGAAQAIDIHGIEKVRVEYLKEETEQLWASLKIQPKNIAFAKNDRARPSREEIAAADNAYQMAQNNIVIDESEISSSAPIMSVSSNDVTNVENNAPPKPRNLGFGLIRSAEAATPSSSGSPFGKPSKPLDAAPNEPIANRERDHQTAADILDDDPISPNDQMDGTASKVADTGANALDPPIPRVGGYMVQAGAFSSDVNANKIANKIKHLGKVAVEATSGGASVLHRVRLGPFTSKGEAESRLHDLFQLGIRDAQIVVYR
jgi:rare lipoprotein A